VVVFSASPALTGTPTAPTAAAATNTTQIATTAHVFAERSNTATLTNKTISADNNTLSGIAASSFVLSNASGNIDGAAVQKAIPAGVVVGTTDTQTLTNKTLSTGTAITAGTINGATIGASTASTGAFTTLTTSGAVTFNDAGANVDFRVEGDTDADLLFVDASADSVGIGTNGPVGKFNVSGSVANNLTTFSTADAATTVLNNVNGVATGRATKVLFRNSGLNLAGIAGVYTGFNGEGDLAGALVFGTQTNVAGGVVERMRITSSGNVGIGTNSPSQKLEVGALGVLRLQTGSTTMDCTPTAGATDGFIWNVSNGYYDWNTSGTTRLRLAANGSMTLFTGDFLCSSAGGLIGSVGTYNTGTGSAANVHILSNGFMLRSTSSLKYKRDVQDASHGLTEVMALRPVTYKGKNPMDGESVFGGLIAEEVHEAGLTEFVQYADDGTPDALAYGNMVSLCIKAIQEMKAIIDSQAERIAALEAK
jgi:hypothetical protein